MTGKVLVDTNVLVYAYDRSERVKQVHASEVLHQLLLRQAGYLSSQILSEFYNCVTRKIAAPLSSAEAYTRVRNLVVSWPVLDLTSLIVLEAARGVHAYQMPIWDAQIWATARLNQAPVIFSEDFNNGAVIEGIRFVNPFAGGFQLSDWV
jgi:predicted nucleic acid-binding protein